MDYEEQSNYMDYRRGRRVVRPPRHPGVWVIYASSQGRVKYRAISVHPDPGMASVDLQSGELIAYWPFGMNLEQAVTLWLEGSAEIREERGY